MLDSFVSSSTLQVGGSLFHALHFTANLVLLIFNEFYFIYLFFFPVGLV
jgi:hypothetical protein